MGDWVYYVTFMRLTDVAEWIKPTDQIHKSTRLSEFIQRQLDGTHATAIAKYLVSQEQRLFNAIVVGVYGGEPNWAPLHVSDPRDVLTDDEESEVQKSMGILRFTGEESLFAIDGQHRVAGIKKVLGSPKAPLADEVAVLLVGHTRSLQGQMRTRRLFTTLNKTAKKVSERDIVALDEDNGFAVVTRMLVDDFDLFKSGGYVAMTGDASISDDAHLVSLVGLYGITRDLYPSKPPAALGTLPAKREVGTARPQNAELEAIFKFNCKYWTLVTQNVPEYKAALSGKQRPGKYRDHLLFRTVGQRAFAGAVQVLLIRGASMSGAVKKLSRAEMSLTSTEWANILWDPVSKTVVPQNRGLAESQLLSLVGEEPRSHAAKARLRTYLAQISSSRPGKVSAKR
jgi:DNA sulfur modification protein DndB